MMTLPIVKHDIGHSRALASARGHDGSLKLVILAGAGISYESPSNIPLGVPLTRGYIDMCLGSGLSSVLENRWSAISNEVERVTGVSCPYLRLESVIEKVDDVDREFGYPRVIDGFREFAAIPPNKQHLHIASLVKRGAHVITANFDCGIERALSPFYVDESAGGSVPVYSDALGVHVGSAGGHDVYHYHGAATDPEGLGATVRRMRRGFSPGFIKLLNKWFQDGCSLLCVGFGCVDFFDATQFFESVPYGEFPGTAVFCNHSAGSSWSCSDADAKRRTDFMKGFGSRHMTFGNTEEVLADIVRLACGDDEVERNRLAADAATPAGADVWRAGFDRVLANGSRDRRMYLIRVMNQFGFYLTDDDMAGHKAPFGASPRVGAPDSIVGHGSARELLEGAAECFLSRVEAMGGRSYFEDESRFAIQSRSVGFDFKMICKDMEFYPPAAVEVENMYDAAKLVRASRESGEDSRDEGLGLEDVCNAVYGVANGVADTIETKYIVAFKDICESLVVKALGGCLRDGDRLIVADAHQCGNVLAGLPMSCFLFTSHLISMLKMCNMMRVLYGDDDASLVSAGKMAELALQVCFTDEIPRIYRHEALICMMRLIEDAGETKFTNSDRLRYRNELLSWKRDTELYLEALKVAGAWSANRPWMEAVDAFLAEGSAGSYKARESALRLVGDGKRVLDLDGRQHEQQGV